MFRYSAFVALVIGVVAYLHYPNFSVARDVFVAANCRRRKLQVPRGFEICPENYAYSSLSLSLGVTGFA
jgi:hypothetical protein